MDWLAQLVVVYYFVFGINFFIQHIYDYYKASYNVCAEDYLLCFLCSVFWPIVIFYEYGSWWWQGTEN